MIQSLKNEYDVANLFNISLNELDRLLIELEYEEFFIPKKKGGYRKITSPNQRLKLVQQRLNYFFNISYESLKTEVVFGFSKKSQSDIVSSPIVANASKHIQKKFILSLDIKDFFESITSKQIVDLFTGPYFKLPINVALILTRLTTYKGFLPTGAPTSPLLSNYIFNEIDNKLKLFSNQLEITYTRYADDITLSSDNIISIDIVEEIQKIVEPFKINTKKTRLIKSHRQQKVTGIVVNQKVNIDRKWLKRSRAMLHDLTLNGLSKAAEKHFKNPGKEHNFIHKLEGNISFIGQVRGEKDTVYLQYRKQFLTYFERKKDTKCDSPF